ncbi:MAG: hypothetical protein IIX93_10920 [Clostridia bacterium]|nr:hypothetical protein [Clostridia bacterium]
MRKITALILSLVFLLSAFCGHAAVLTKAEIYEASVSSLKSYLNDEPTEALGDLVLAFGKLGDYKFSAPFMMYASVLRSVESEDYSTIQSMLRMLRMNSAFTDYLASDPDFGPLDNLESYAAGRKAEAEGDTDAAVQAYEACASYYDSYSRLIRLYADTLESDYQEAMACFSLNTLEGYTLAAALFESLDEYKDSRAMAEASKMFLTVMEEAMKEAENAEVKSASAAEEEPETMPAAAEDTEMMYKAGDTVYFGSYYQEYGSNTKRAVEWRVLDIADGKLLLLSEYGLERRQFDSGSALWEESDICAWLNGDFMNRAFSEREKRAVKPAPEYEATSSEANAPGKDIFLLSLEEAVRYNLDGTTCKGTSRAMVNRTFEYDSWWFRDTDKSVRNNRNAFYSHAYYRSSSKNTQLLIRPAVWVDAGSFEKKGVYLSDQTGAAAFEAGDRVYFGAYDQDNNRLNGKEPVKWRVMDVQNGRMLVISEYTLDHYAYHKKDEAVTWEKSELRFWLNDYFYRTTFSAEEKSRIMETTVVNAYNNTTGIYAGNDTQDRIFVFSIDEANRYFADNEDRRASHMNQSGESWVLRSPGSATNTVAFVSKDGKVNADGLSTTYKDENYRIVGNEFNLRPALWIRIGP